MRSFTPSLRPQSIRVRRRRGDEVAGHLRSSRNRTSFTPPSSAVSPRSMLKGRVRGGHDRDKLEVARKTAHPSRGTCGAHRVASICVASARFCSVRVGSA